MEFKSNHSLSKHFELQLLSFGILLILLPVLRYAKGYNPSVEISYLELFIIFIVSFLVLIGCQVFVQRIKIDYRNNTIIFTYYIFFLLKRQKKMFKNELAYNTIKKLVGLKMKKTLIILKNGKKLFTFTENADGWHKETIAEVEKCLKTMGISMCSSK